MTQTLQSQMEIPKIAVVTRQQLVQYFVEQVGNGVALEMLRIPGGSFVMGEQGSGEEDSRHRVELQTFCMGKYPVTQAQWRAVAEMEQIQRELKPNPSGFKGDELPVEQVNWHEAIEFCQRLSRNSARDYRLPSEAEWEYACRAGTMTRYHFGEVIAPDLANYGGNQSQTTPVGSFGIANAFGLYDMHGNVWEWCADPWHDSYEGAPTDGSAWIAGSELAEVIYFAIPVMNVKQNPDTGEMQAVLAVGQANGVEKGAKFAIYPGNTIDFANKANQIAVAQVVEWGAAESVCKLEPIAGKPLNVEPGCQAIQISTSANLIDSNSSYRVLRGGSWGDNLVFCRSACRLKHVVDRRYYKIGFRVVCSLA